MKEIWKDIKGYEGLYQVSNYGRVKSLAKTIIYSNGREHFYPEKILKPCKQKNGYFKIGLVKDGNYKNVFVHRLVAYAFIPKPQNCDQVNHKDENRQNNRSNNLEWCNCQYNVDYSLSKQVCQYDFDGNLIMVWKSIIEASRNTNVPDTNIIQCCRGDYKQAGGYVWKYKDKREAVT